MDDYTSIRELPHSQLTSTCFTNLNLTTIVPMRNWTKPKTSSYQQSKWSTWIPAEHPSRTLQCCIVTGSSMLFCSSQWFCCWGWMLYIQLNLELCYESFHLFYPAGSVPVNGLSQTQKNTVSLCCTASGTLQELSPCKVLQQSTKLKHRNALFCCLPLSTCLKTNM